MVYPTLNSAFYVFLSFYSVPAVPIQYSNTSLSVLPFVYFHYPVFTSSKS